MKLQALFVVFAAGLLIAADASKDDGKDDPKKLQGTWIVVSGEKDGVKPPEDQLKDIKIEFKDAKLIISAAGQSRDLATFTIDGSKKPKTIDLKLNEGADKDMDAKGIYAFEGDQLKICISKPKSERPKDFSTKEGSNQTCFVLKKEK